MISRRSIFPLFNWYSILNDFTTFLSILATQGSLLFLHPLPQNRTKQNKNKTKKNTTKKNQKETKQQKQPPAQKNKIKI